MKEWILLLLAMLLPEVLMAQRLPRIVFPNHYDLLFIPNLSQETFDGKVAIHVSIQKPVREIVLHSLEIEFKSVVIESGINSQKSHIRKATVKLEPEKEFAILAVAEPVEPGPAIIRIEYTGKLNRDLRGFYIGVTTHGRSNSPAKYAASQGQATDIRRAFPCFDEPEMKATFSIAMVVDKGITAISNEDVISDLPGPGPNQHTIRFASTPRLSSYLVALLAGDFHRLKGEAEGVPLGICVLGDKSSMGNFSLELSKQLLSFFNDYYGIPYPFGKLDQIAIPDFAAGAMENAGAIIYRESALLIDSKTSSLTRRKATASTVSHEIAHMWFGDLVTMRWWNDIWLNEGFATWMASKPLKKLHPEWRFDLEETMETEEAMDVDVFFNTRPIRAEAYSSREIDALFDPIAYQKTASLLRMIESYIGEKDFRSGVNDYLKNYSYGNSESFDFFEALASASDSSADEVMNSYVNQAGVPIVSVTAVSCESEETLLSLKQRRFTLSANQPDSSQRWVIPICQNTDDSKQTCRLLRQNEETLRFPGCRQTPFLNRNGAGYFVTEYSDDLEPQLIEAANKLKEPERLAFARDQWFLIMANRRPVGNFLNLAESLHNERASQFVENLVKKLQYVADYFVPPDQVSAYQTWVRSLLQSMLREIGNASPQEPEDRRLARAEILKGLAMIAQDPETIQTVLAMADKYFDDRTSIDPATVSTILDAAAAVGDARLYDQIVSAYHSGGTPEETRRFLELLPQFRKPELLERTMKFALSDEVRNQDTGRMLAAVIKNPAGGKRAWNFIKAHWSDITRKLSDAMRLTIVISTGALCDPMLKEDIKEFFEQHPVPGSERSLAQALENISVCTAAKSRQQVNLSQWLSARSSK